MPTVGWIYEGALDRFCEEQPKSTSGSLPKPIFVCKFCDKHFPSLGELQRHYNFDHPLELPVLYVQSKPLLHESVIRSALLETDVELIQCDSCQVQSDGGAWQNLSVDDFRKQFTKQNNSTWNVRLVHNREMDHARTEEKYHIRFRIPKKISLNQVDELFIRLLVVDELRHSHLEAYEDGLPVDAPAREYGSALGDYALGIIMKERRSPAYAPVGFEEFAVKMRSALEVLRLFNRPVPLAVSGSIRFNLNDFNDYGVFTAPTLETALKFFRAICTTTGINVTGESALPSALQRNDFKICPVDKITHRLLKVCESLAGDRKLSMYELEALRQLTRGMVPVSEQDLSKIHVICAEGYFRLDRHSEALPHLQAIQFDPMLKSWSQSRLEDILLHEH